MHLFRIHSALLWLGSYGNLALLSLRVLFPLLAEWDAIHCNGSLKKTQGELWHLHFCSQPSGGTLPAFKDPGVRYVYSPIMGRKAAAPTEQRLLWWRSHSLYPYSNTLIIRSSTSVQRSSCLHCSFFFVLWNLFQQVQMQPVQKCMVFDNYITINEMHHLMIISVMKTDSVNYISTLQFINHNWWADSLLTDCKILQSFWISFR